MDNNRSRPLFAEHEPVRVAVPAHDILIDRTEVIERKYSRENDPFTDWNGDHCTHAQDRWYYIVPEMPDTFIREDFLKKLPDIGTFEGTFFNPNKVKTPEIA